MPINSTLAFAVGALALIGISPYVMPGEVTIEREAVIDASPEAVYQVLSSNQGFQRINPWKDADPTLQITLSGPEAGIGSAFSFSGKDGEGTQTITALDPARRVVTEIDLGAMGKPVQSFTLEPAGEGVRVIWSTRADFGLNPIGRIIGLFMDDRLGPVYEQGLKNLANVV
ncbi:MAG: SRPBCC family protein [Pseudomonadota bacterium]